MLLPHSTPLKSIFKKPRETNFLSQNLCFGLKLFMVKIKYLKEQTDRTSAAIKLIFILTKKSLLQTISFREKKNLERGARAAAGGGIGATVGGIIGGCLAGFCTGGLGAPAGAAIGIAIGGGVGAGASLLAPVRDAREVASFAFSSYDKFIGTHKKSCGNDILTDGQEVRLIIK